MTQARMRCVAFTTVRNARDSGYTTGAIQIQGART